MIFYYCNELVFNIFCVFQQALSLNPFLDGMLKII